MRASGVRYGEASRRGFSRRVAWRPHRSCTPIGAVALEALKHVHDAEVDARAIDWVQRVSRATAEDDPDLRAVVRLLHYLFDASSGIAAETLKAIASVGPERTEETVMTLARQWIAEGEAKGRVEGE
ncbi:MAG: hypothetical protein EXR76_13655 [Myxococcales bacterium]|nr:hypothetical protein [Myxococcales bacterium]